MHMLKTIGKFSHKLVGPFFEQYVKDKYGSRTILCIVTGENGMLFLNFDSFESKPASIKLEDNPNIRQMCGQYALLRYGIPKPMEHPPLMVLLPMPSALMTLGVMESARFIRDWPGDSKVGALTVVEYIVIGAKHV